MEKLMTKGLLILLLVFTCATQAQVKVVTGTVTDETGSPLPGASAIIKGSSIGVSSDFDGKFTINARENDILIISFIGYISQQVAVQGKTAINVQLIPDVSSLDEVVVVGYGTQKKSDLTGAVVSIKAEDFTPGANYNAAQLLNGSASGVNVSQVSSAPGASLKIQIRGAGSINSSNDVLFVIDGLPGLDPSSLSTEDIESIEILKDASSASIYGTRAANGVVLITTKKGKSGKSTFTYSKYLGSQEVAKKMDILGASDYMQLINLRETSSGGIAKYTDIEIANAGKGTDWQNEILRTAFIKNHNVTMSGGNDKGTYYVGLNYFNQDGIVKKSSYQKYNARINVQMNPIDNLKLLTNINITQGKYNDIIFSNSTNEAAGPINSAIQYDPTISPLLDENGKYFRNNLIALDNPLALIEGVTNQANSTNLSGLIQADYEFIKNLTGTIRLGIDINNGRSDYYRNTLTLLGAGRDGYASVTSYDYTHWLTEYLLKYENTFNEKHKFSILGGATFENFTTRNLGGSSIGFLSDVTNTNNLGSGNGDEGDNVSSSKFVNTLNGFIGRINYGFEDKYLFTASVRVDGSSRFSDKNKYAVFPSGSIAWRLNNESFFENADWLSDLKLRIGYGELGNQGIGNFETINTLIAGGNAVLGGQIQQGVVPVRLPNPDLKWETTSEVNVGFDYGFLNNRISGSIDYFNRNTKDQLFFKPLPAAVGFSGVWVNFGEVVNKGVDFSVKSKNINSGDFKWNTSATLSILKNEVTKLPDFTQEIIGGSIGFTGGYTIVKEGAPLRAFYGYQISGIFQEGDDIANSPTPANNANYKAGMPKFVDQNNDGVIDSDDRVILGNPFPDFTFGINNSLSYKDFSFDLFITGVQGIKTIDGNVAESIYPTNSSRNAISTYFLDRWTPENPSNTLPSLENPSLYGGGRSINTLTVRDASFVRLKNITIGYTAPFAEKLKLASLRFYLAADNLITITDYEGYDPDASSAGIGVAKQSYNSYPLARTFRFGIDVKF
jgi:TonB-linked SusC/RagA family outer membrane protein